jgi:hypothetical protein
MKQDDWQTVNVFLYEFLSLIRMLLHWDIDKLSHLSWRISVNPSVLADEIFLSPPTSRAFFILCSRRFLDGDAEVTRGSRQEGQGFLCFL